MECENFGSAELVYLNRFHKSSPASKLETRTWKYLLQIVPIQNAKKFAMQ